MGIVMSTESSPSMTESRMALMSGPARFTGPPWADERIVAIDTSQVIQRQMNAICAELCKRLFDQGKEQ
jgi:hypothetical protein